MANINDIYDINTIKDNINKFLLSLKTYLNRIKFNDNKYTIPTSVSNIFVNGIELKEKDIDKIENVIELVRLIRYINSQFRGIYNVFYQVFLPKIAEHKERIESLKDEIKSIKSQKTEKETFDKMREIYPDLTEEEFRKQTALAKKFLNDRMAILSAMKEKIDGYLKSLDKESKNVNNFLAKTRSRLINNNKLINTEKKTIKKKLGESIGDLEFIINTYENKKGYEQIINRAKSLLKQLNNFKENDWNIPLDMAFNYASEIDNLIRLVNKKKSEARDIIIEEQTKKAKRKIAETQDILEKGLNFTDEEKFVNAWITKKANDGTLFKSNLSNIELINILKKNFPNVSNENLQRALINFNIKEESQRQGMWNTLKNLNERNKKEEKQQQEVDPKDVNAVITKLINIHNIPIGFVNKIKNNIIDLLKKGKSIYTVTGIINKTYNNELKKYKEKQKMALTNILKRAQEIANKYYVYLPSGIALIGDKVKPILAGWGWDLDKFKKNIEELFKKKQNNFLKILNEKTNNGTLVTQRDYRTIKYNIFNQLFYKKIEELYNDIHQAKSRYYNAIQETKRKNQNIKDIKMQQRKNEEDIRQLWENSSFLS